MALPPDLKSIAGGIDAVRTLADKRQTSYKGGSSGGGEDMLEARVARIEDEMKGLRSDVTDIKVSLARIEAEIGHLVSYKWLTIYVLGIAALVFKDEFLALFGA